VTKGAFVLRLSVYPSTTGDFTTVTSTQISSFVSFYSDVLKWLACLMIKRCNISSCNGEIMYKLVNSLKDKRHYCRAFVIAKSASKLQGNFHCMFTNVSTVCYANILH
jgi:hypothetical protein